MNRIARRVHHRAVVAEMVALGLRQGAPLGEIVLMVIPTMCVLSTIATLAGLR